MKKSELIKMISENSGIKQNDVGVVLSTLTNVIIETLKNDRTEKITLDSLGAFKVKNVSERKGINFLGSKAGKEYCIPAHDEISFKINKNIKKLN